MEPGASATSITQLLLQSKKGDMSALQTLAPLVQAELRRVAASYLRNERPGHTLQPTALVNEAWMRMAQQEHPPFECRAHFVAIAARYMRQILVEHARRRNAHKRGFGAPGIALEDVVAYTPQRPADFIALDSGLADLGRLDERQARIVELHYFGGLTYEEIAGYLEIGRSTVIRDLRLAQIWLRDYMSS
jgi:RNA polymerase sigma factor (TIGR02999 family)